VIRKAQKKTKDLCALQLLEMEYNLFGQKKEVEACPTK
jgi:hypothetical protein